MKILIEQLKIHGNKPRLIVQSLEFKDSSSSSRSLELVRAIIQKLIDQVLNGKIPFGDKVLRELLLKEY